MKITIDPTAAVYADRRLDGLLWLGSAERLDRTVAAVLAEAQREASNHNTRGADKVLWFDGVVVGRQRG